MAALAAGTAVSGEQTELAYGRQRAVVVEVGGGLRTYSVGELAVLDGYGEDELRLSGRGQLMAPWPNRLEDGQYTFDGVGYQLPLDEPEAHNAIHGLVVWASWRVVEREPHRAVLEHVLHPRAGYPFALTVGVEYALADDGLTVRTTATNTGTAACPYGTGAHPYLRLGTALVDPLELAVPAETVLRSDDRGLPTRTVPVAGTEFDFRSARPIGGTKIDHGFTGLRRDQDGLARVVLRDPPAGGRLTLWVDAGYSWLMVYTGDSRPDVNRRSIAIEPMTCPPNAFRTGESLVRLEPWASHSASWGIAVEA
jgi:galactose mutarotase-like enzyme